MRDTREIQTEPVRGGNKTESKAGVEFSRNQFQPVAVAELAGVVGGGIARFEVFKESRRDAYENQR